MTVDVCVRSIEKSLMKEENDDVCVCVCLSDHTWLFVRIHVPACDIQRYSVDSNGLREVSASQLRSEMKTRLFQLGYEIYYSESQ